MLNLLLLLEVDAQACEGSASIVINEFLANPSSTDSGHEWVELFNKGSESVDISEWVLEGGTSSYSEIVRIPIGTVIEPGRYYLIGDEYVTGDWGAPLDLEVTMTLSNASSNTDSIRILDCNDVVVDTVVYGNSQNSTDPWVDDFGNVPTSFAPKPVSGKSNARIPNGYDSNNSGLDFVATNPSPKSQNGGGGSTGGSCDSNSGVVINEFVSDPAGSDTDKEWVELFNTSNQDLDLSDWKLEGGASSYSTLASVPEGTILYSGEYLLIGGSLISEDLGIDADVEMSGSLGNASSNADAIRIVDCNDNIIDTVIYGNSLNETDPWLDDFGNVPTSFAPKPGSGQSVGRVPNGVDTNVLEDDFDALSFVSPREANDITQSCDGAFDIKINEFLPNPDGDDESYEWIELYNTASQNVDLSGWALQWGTSSYGSSFTLPEGTTIAANSYLLIGGESVTDTDIMVPIDSDLSMGAASSNADSLRLLHCGPGVSDTVIYGPTSDEGTAENTDGWKEDDGIISSFIAPKPVSGISISRRIDGSDSDVSGMDFMVSVTNTPGEANPEVQCFEDNGTIKINEIFPNPDGSDSGSEWIELYNTGTEAVRLDNWSIETASSSYSTRFIFPAEITIEPGDFFLIGEELVPSEVADINIDTTLSLGNASTGFDGIRLKDCPGNVVDTILYAKMTAVPSEDEIEFLDDAGDETVAIFPDSGKSIGRYPDGADTDNNFTDLGSNMTPTPRAPNIQSSDQGGGPGDGVVTPGQGCGQSPSAAEQPSKCSYVSSFPKTAWLVLLFVLFRREDSKQ